MNNCHNITNSIKREYPHRRGKLPSLLAEQICRVSDDASSSRANTYVAAAHVDELQIGQRSKTLRKRLKYHIIDRTSCNKLSYFAAWVAIGPLKLMR
jgi:hypothetical protein